MDQEALYLPRVQAVANSLLLQPAHGPGSFRFTKSPGCGQQPPASASTWTRKLQIYQESRLWPTASCFSQHMDQEALDLPRVQAVANSLLLQPAHGPGSFRFTKSPDCGQQPPASASTWTRKLQIYQESRLWPTASCFSQHMDQEALDLPRVQAVANSFLLQPAHGPGSFRFTKSPDCGQQPPASASTWTRKLQIYQESRLWPTASCFSQHMDQEALDLPRVQTVANSLLLQPAHGPGSFRFTKSPGCGLQPPASASTQTRKLQIYQESRLWPTASCFSQHMDQEALDLPRVQAVANSLLLQPAHGPGSFRFTKSPGCGQQPPASASTWTRKLQIYQESRLWPTASRFSQHMDQEALDLPRVQTVANSLPLQPAHGPGSFRFTKSPDCGQQLPASASTWTRELQIYQESRLWPTASCFSQHMDQGALDLPRVQAVANSLLLQPAHGPGSFRFTKSPGCGQQLPASASTWTRKLQIYQESRLWPTASCFSQHMDQEALDLPRVQAVANSFLLQPAHGPGSFRFTKSPDCGQQPPASASTWTRELQIYQESRLWPTASCFSQHMDQGALDLPRVQTVANSLLLQPAHGPGSFRFTKSPDCGQQLPASASTWTRKLQIYQESRLWPTASCFSQHMDQGALDLPRVQTVANSLLLQPAHGPGSFRLTKSPGCGQQPPASASTWTRKLQIDQESRLWPTASCFSQHMDQGALDLPRVQAVANSLLLQPAHGPGSSRFTKSPGCGQQPPASASTWTRELQIYQESRLWPTASCFSQHMDQEALDLPRVQAVANSFLLQPAHGPGSFRFTKSPDCGQQPPASASTWTRKLQIYQESRLWPTASCFSQHMDQEALDLPRVQTVANSLLLQPAHGPGSFRFTKSPDCGQQPPASASTWTRKLQIYQESRLWPTASCFSQHMDQEALDLPRVQTVANSLLLQPAHGPGSFRFTKSPGCGQQLPASASTWTRKLQIYQESRLWPTASCFSQHMDQEALDLPRVQAVANSLLLQPAHGPRSFRLTKSPGCGQQLPASASTWTRKPQIDQESRLWPTASCFSQHMDQEALDLPRIQAVANSFLLQPAHGPGSFRFTNSPGCGQQLPASASTWTRKLQIYQESRLWPTASCFSQHMDQGALDLPRVQAVANSLLLQPAHGPGSFRFTKSPGCGQQPPASASTWTRKLQIYQESRLWPTASCFSQHMDQEALDLPRVQTVANSLLLQPAHGPGSFRFTKSPDCGQQPPASASTWTRELQIYQESRLWPTASCFSQHMDQEALDLPRVQTVANSLLLQPAHGPGSFRFTKSPDCGQQPPASASTWTRKVQIYQESRLWPTASCFSQHMDQGALDLPRVQAVANSLLLQPAHGPGSFRFTKSPGCGQQLPASASTWTRKLQIYQESRLWPTASCFSQHMDQEALDLPRVQAVANSFLLQPAHGPGSFRFTKSPGCGQQLPASASTWTRKLQIYQESRLWPTASCFSQHMDQEALDLPRVQAVANSLLLQPAHGPGSFRFTKSPDCGQQPPASASTWTRELQIYQESRLWPTASCFSQHMDQEALDLPRVQAVANSFLLQPAHGPGSFRFTKSPGCGQQLPASASTWTRKLQIYQESRLWPTASCFSQHMDQGALDLPRVQAVANSLLLQPAHGPGSFRFTKSPGCGQQPPASASTWTRKLQIYQESRLWPTASCFSQHMDQEALDLPRVQAVANSFLLQPAHGPGSFRFTKSPGCGQQLPASASTWTRKLQIYQESRLWPTASCFSQHMDQEALDLPRVQAVANSFLLQPAHGPGSFRFTKSPGCGQQLPASASTWTRKLQIYQESRLWPTASCFSQHMDQEALDLPRVQAVANSLLLQPAHGPGSFRFTKSPDCGQQPPASASTWTRELQIYQESRLWPTASCFSQHMDQEALDLPRVQAVANSFLLQPAHGPGSFRFTKSPGCGQQLPASASTWTRELQIYQESRLWPTASCFSQHMDQGALDLPRVQAVANSLLLQPAHGPGSFRFTKSPGCGQQPPASASTWTRKLQIYQESRLWPTASCFSQHMDQEALDLPRVQAVANSFLLQPAHGPGSFRFTKSPDCGQQPPASASTWTRKLQIYQESRLWPTASCFSQHMDQGALDLPRVQTVANSLLLQPAHGPGSFRFTKSPDCGQQPPASASTWTRKLQIDQESRLWPTASCFSQHMDQEALDLPRVQAVANSLLLQPAHGPGSFRFTKSPGCGQQPPASASTWTRKLQIYQESRLWPTASCFSQHMDQEALDLPRVQTVANSLLLQPAHGPGSFRFTKSPDCGQQPPASASTWTRELQIYQESRLWPTASCFSQHMDQEALDLPRVQTVANSLLLQPAHGPGSFRFTKSPDCGQQPPASASTWTRELQIYQESRLWPTASCFSQHMDQEALDLPRVQTVANSLLLQPAHGPGSFRFTKSPGCGQQPPASASTWTRKLQIYQESRLWPTASYFSQHMDQGALDLPRVQAVANSLLLQPAHGPGSFRFTKSPIMCHRSPLPLTGTFVDVDANGNLQNEIPVH